MKIAFQATGTAEDVAKQVDAEAKTALLAATDADEHAGVEGAYDALGSVLTSVEGDRQATVTLQAEVRGTELVHVYLDVTIVPSGAVQEAKAARMSAAEFEAAAE